MGTITDKLNKLAETKSAIKTAIVNKGVSISDSDTFASYANKIASIEGGGSTATEGIYGVFIYDTNGNLTKPEEWDTANNDLAVGVAVIDECCSFVIGKEPYFNKEWSSQLYGTDVSGILSTIHSPIAHTDYAGEANSAIVRGLTSGEDNIFNLAYSKTITVNGTTLYGYVGALGEYTTATNNINEIDSALSKIGGTSISSGYYWTSTQHSSNNAWNITLSGNDVNNDKRNSNYVRAFYHLDYPNSKKPIIVNNSTVLVAHNNCIVERDNIKRIIIEGMYSYPNIDTFKCNTNASSISHLFSHNTYWTTIFYGVISCKNIIINAPKCTKINYIFGNKSEVFNLNDTINITLNCSDSLKDISYLLYNYKGENINLNISNVQGIKNFSSMFASTNITIINELDTSGGTSFYSMFAECNKLIKVESLSLKSLNTEISYSYFTGYSNRPNLRYALLKDFGTGQKMTSAAFQYWPNWGIEDETVPLSAGARQSLIDTLITYSYDRATAGYSACSVKLSDNTKALLTEDEIAQMTAKGYTLA